jgi:chitodextrinase
MPLLATGFLLLLIVPATLLDATPAQAQILGRGVFEHHVHVHSPLVSGYPNPTKADAQAQLQAFLDNPYISGVQLSYDWRYLEPSPGSYRWDIIEADIAPWAAIGKKVWIEIHTANKRGTDLNPRGYPDWLAASPYNVPIVGYYHVDSTGEERGRYPVFWNPTYQQRWATFVAAFAAHFDGHPAIEFVVPTGYGAGTEPRLSAEDNDYYYNEWMAAGLDPGLSLTRVRSQKFYTSAEASSLGTEAVYLNTNLWAIDLFRDAFTQTRLMINVAQYDEPWEQERYLQAVSQGIGIGNNGLTARVRSDFREFARVIQLTYGVPVGFFEFGPYARTDSGPDETLGTGDDFSINLLELYRRGMGIDGSAVHAPWSRMSYMPAGKQDPALETEQGWMDALAWVFNATFDSTQTTQDTTPPTIPKNLAVTSVSSSSISLSWTASTDNVVVAGYVISRNGVQVGTSTTTTHTDSGLTEATSYTYTVAAYDAGGNMSKASSQIVASTSDVTAPSVPTGLTATTVTATQISLAWTASTDNVAVTGYKVYRDGVQIATTTTPSYSNTGLVQATTYSYTVAAHDAAGNTSKQSASLRVTTGDTTAPTKPTGLKATVMSAQRIDLSWTASTDNVAVTGYKIYRGGVQIATTTKTTLTNNNLTEATTYTYTVAAYDAAGNTSAQSTAVTATTLDVTAPAKPTGLTATPVSKSQISLSWAPSSDNVAVTGYKIYRGGVQIATTTGTTYANSGLTEATTYSYTVAAYDAAGNTSGQSATASATTLDVTAPSVPTGLKATPYSATRIDLAWSPSTDNRAVTGYKVYRNGAQIATTSSLTYIDRNLARNTTYSYTVAAYDAAGNTSAQSATVKATTLP